jgi:tol-pal system protein YbgF
MLLSHMGYSWWSAESRLRFSAGRTLMLCLLAAVTLLAGCASRKQLEIVQDDTRAIRASVDTLRMQQQMALDSIYALQRQIYDLKASSAYGSTALEEKVQALAARLDDILSRMDRTLEPLQEFLRRQGGTDTTKSAALGTDYFDAAQRDLVAGNYDLAEVGFLQFLENYPKSDLADDARYGLAETYYNRQRWDEAVDQYKRVLNANPQGSKAPAAMLKLGLCCKAQNKTKDARKEWEDLVKKFPFSDEAKVAAQRLDELKTKK